mgnify:FL=1
MRSEQIRQYSVKSPMDREHHQVTERVLYPEELDNADFQQALALAAIASVSRNPGWVSDEAAAIQNKFLAANIPHSYVLDPKKESPLEKKSPYMVKRYRTKREAGIQAATLNTLNMTFAEHESDITTSRVLALVGDGYSPPAGVIQRASGKSLRERYGMDRSYRRYEALMTHLGYIQQKADEIIGCLASRVLINDIRREYNEGTNVFSVDTVTKDGGYYEAITIFDQPFTEFTSGLCIAALSKIAWEHRGLRGMLDMATELL